MSEELPLPSHFAELKREIAASYPDFEERVTRAWNEILEQLVQVSATIVKEGSEVSNYPLFDC